MGTGWRRWVWRGGAQNSWLLCCTPPWHVRDDPDRYYWKRERFGQFGLPVPVFGVAAQSAWFVGAGGHRLEGVGLGDPAPQNFIYLILNALEYILFLGFT